MGFPHYVPPGHSLRVGWRNPFLNQQKNGSSSPCAASLFGDGCVMCRCVRFTTLLRREIVVDVTYELRVNYKMGHRNWYLEGWNDRQMTPRGYPNFNSYLKIYVFSFSGQTDGRTDGRMHGQRHSSGVGFPHYVPPG